MKYRILISLILIIFLVFIIYISNIDNKIYYFNVIDNKYEFETYNELLQSDINDLERYVNYESDNQYRITDLIRDINDNIKINDKTIQNILIKADITTIRIGNNELNYKISNTNMNELFDYSDELLEDLEKLIKLIRKYSKEKIALIGYFNNNEYYTELYSYINVRAKDICDKYNIIFIETNNQFNIDENVNIYEKIKKKLLF